MNHLPSFERTRHMAPRDALAVLSDAELDRCWVAIVVESLLDGTSTLQLTADLAEVRNRYRGMVGQVVLPARLPRGGGRNKRLDRPARRG